MRLSKVYVIVFLMSIYVCALSAQSQQSPRLTVVIVADQFPFYYTKKLGKHLSHGLHDLLTQGMVYTNAHHAHAVPETTPGHHALSTGALPCDHSAIANQWLTSDGVKVPYADDDAPNTAVLTPTKKGSAGKSAHNTRVEGLSDLFMMHPASGARHHAYAFSIKEYPALSTANRLGKAIWFDTSSGLFTSSKAYFDQLPGWLTSYNQTAKICSLKQVVWKSAFERDSAAYKLPFIDNYQFSAIPSIADASSIAIDRTKDAPFEMYAKTPHASAALFDVAKQCIKHTLKRPKDRMILWLLLSNLDLAGHLFGPDSFEVVDTVYHLDRQIKDFMKYCSRKVGMQRCLFAFTSDHGICPIPEISHQQGMNIARRIMAKDLIASINARIQELYGHAGVIKAYEPSSFVFDRQVFAACSEEEIMNIKDEVKSYVRAQKGIKAVWLREELEQATFAPDDVASLYKTQLYADRGGDLFIQTEPYCLVTHYPTGTSHSSPYAYDTNVPIVLYRAGHLEKKTITEKVWATALPVTLAHLLGIGAKLSASHAGVLPGVCE